MPSIKTKAVNAQQLAQLSADQGKDNIAQVELKDLPPEKRAEVLDMKAKYAATQEAEANRKAAALGIQPMAFSIEAQQGFVAPNNPVNGGLVPQSIGNAGPQEVEITFPGGTVLLGPPQVWTELILKEMFASFKDISQYEFLKMREIAKYMLFVRAINGQRMRTAVTWGEIENICRQLGQLGCDAVRTNYMIRWPDLDGEGLYWSEVKKNVPESGLPEKSEPDNVNQLQ